SKKYRPSLLAIPKAFFDATTPWSRVSVVASQVGAVLGQAPDFLKRMIGWDAADAASGPLNLVDEISFDVATATIVRPWFDLSQLERKLWAWIINGTPVLSDGGDPPQGDLPAIPDKIVFARNAEVKLKPGTNSGQVQPIVKNLGFLPFM